MKTLYLKSLIAVLFLALVCVACKKSEDKPVANIVFTVIPRSESFPPNSLFISLRGSGTTIIDWGGGFDYLGDGLGNDTIELLPGFIKELSRYYNSADPYTVRIYGENINWFGNWGHTLTSLDISRADSLIVLDCINGQFTKLNLSKNTKLRYLNCSNIPLIQLDLSKNTELISLGCSNTPLIQLDLSKNTELISLTCRGTQITSLDLSKQIKLETLNCNESQLKSLILSTNHDKLRSLHLWGCQLTDETLNDLFHTLPFCYYEQKPINNNSTIAPNCDGYIFIGNNPGTDNCNISIAEGKGWKIDKVFTL